MLIVVACSFMVLRDGYASQPGKVSDKAAADLLFSLSWACSCAAAASGKEGAWLGQSRLGFGGSGAAAALLLQRNFAFFPSFL